MTLDNQTRGLIIEIVKETVKETDRIRSGEYKRRQDNRLRNIKLLLKNYRSFKQHKEAAKEDIPKLMSALDLEELSDESFEIKAILANRKRTAAMVVYIERMLDIYEQSCHQSDSTEEKRRFKVIYDLYIDDVKKSVDQVANGHNLNRRTVYKDIDKACKSLSVLMFGVDGILFDSVK